MIFKEFSLYGPWLICTLLLLHDATYFEPEMLGLTQIQYQPATGVNHVSC